MNKIFLTFFQLFFLHIVVIYSQPIVDFGRITMNELQMDSYPKDKEAEAVIIFDIGDTRFRRNAEGGFDVVFERRTKIKIFTEAGLSYGELSIPLYRHGNIYEKVEEISGVTTNIENDKIVTYNLNPENKYKEKINEYYDLEKYVMPYVKAGSIIEFKYKVRSQYIFKLNDWEFQHRIPVMYSEYTVRMIPFYSYVFLLQGTNQFDFHDSYVDKGLQRQYGSISFNDMVYVYALKDVPAFKDEDFISSYDDYVIKLGFQLEKIIKAEGTEISKLTTWEEMVKELIKYSDFGGYQKSAIKQSEKLISAIDLTGKSEIEKIDAIVEYVKNNYNWNGRKSYFASKKVKEFIQQKVGNSADINLFLVGMLRAAGLKAVPVILSTRDHGKISNDYPFVHFFNYVVARIIIDGKEIITDATSKLYANTDIPLQCINEKGLIIEKGEINWVDLSKPRNKSYTQNLFSITFNKNKDSLICNFEIKAVGYEAVGLKSRFEDKTYNIKKYLNNNGYEVFDSVNILNYNNPEKPYVIKSNIKLPVENIDGKLYLSPFLNEPPQDNIFKQSKRQNPVDLVYTREEIYVSKILIPEGFKINHIPEDVNLDNKYYEINYNPIVDDNKLIIKANFEFKFPVYTAEAYNLLKYFYNQIIKYFNDNIVLEKI